MFRRPPKCLFSDDRQNVYTHAWARASLRCEPPLRVPAAVYRHVYRHARGHIPLSWTRVRACLLRRISKSSSTRGELSPRRRRLPTCLHTRLHACLRARLHTRLDARLERASHRLAFRLLSTDTSTDTSTGMSTDMPVGASLSRGPCAGMLAAVNFEVEFY